MTKIQELMGRLFKACQRLPNWGDDLFSRGQAVIERKFGVVMWLSSFKPTGMVEGESPTTTVNITPTK